MHSHTPIDRPHKLFFSSRSGLKCSLFHYNQCTQVLETAPHPSLGSPTQAQFLPGLPGPPKDTEKARPPVKEDQPQDLEGVQDLIKGNNECLKGIHISKISKEQQILTVDI